MTVLVFGTFDIVHPGHLDFFRQARSFGDRLVVGLARDITVKKVKGRLPLHNENERRSALTHIDLIDEVILGDTKDYYQVLERVRPDVIALGYDQKIFVDKLADEIKKRGLAARVVRLKPFHPEKYKSSRLRGQTSM